MSKKGIEVGTVIESFVLATRNDEGMDINMIGKKGESKISSYSRLLSKYNCC